MVAVGAGDVVDDLNRVLVEGETAAMGEAAVFTSGINGATGGCGREGMKNDVGLSAQRKALTGSA